MKDRYCYLLTIIDFRTRFIEAVPLKRVGTRTTCQALLQVFTCFAVPEVILTDNGGNFMAEVTEELLKVLQSPTAAPQSLTRSYSTEVGSLTAM